MSMINEAVDTRCRLKAIDARYRRLGLAAPRADQKVIARDDSFERKLRPKAQSERPPPPQRRERGLDGEVGG